MEEQPYALTMQQEMISEIETARPEFIVMAEVPLSWLIKPKSEMHIVTWMRQCLEDHYETSGCRGYSK